MTVTGDVPRFGLGYLLIGKSLHKNEIFAGEPEENIGTRMKNGYLGCHGHHRNFSKMSMYDSYDSGVWKWAELPKMA